MKYIIKIAVLILLIPSIAFSAPVINTWSSNLVGGSSTVIGGTSFGIHADYAPTEAYLNAAWADFDTEYADTDVWETDFRGPELVTGGIYQRLNSLRCGRGREIVDEGYTNVFGDVTTGANPQTFFHSNLTSESEILFISGWFTQDPDYLNEMAESLTSSPQAKFISGLSVDDINGNQYWNFRTSSQIGGGATNAEDGRSSQSPVELRFTSATGNDVVNAGEWHRWDVVLDVSKGVGVGEGFSTSRFYVDGKDYTVEPNYLALPTLEASYFFRFFSDPITGYIYLDDAFVNNTRSRVEISESPVWDDTQRFHKEIQLATFWSDGSITFTVNQGSFADNDVAYIFVIDEDGVASTGKQITFGTTPTPGTTSFSLTGETTFSPDGLTTYK